jgi:hypothetical protein
MIGEVLSKLPWLKEQADYFFSLYNIWAIG